MVAGCVPYGCSLRYARLQVRGDHFFELRSAEHAAYGAQGQYSPVTKFPPWLPIYRPLGSAPARPLCLLSARLAALGQLGTPRVRPSHWGAPPPPRGLKRAASKVANFTAFECPSRHLDTVLALCAVAVGCHRTE